MDRALVVEICAPLATAAVIMGVKSLWTLNAKLFVLIAHFDDHKEWAKAELRAHDSRIQQLETKKGHRP